MEENIRLAYRNLKKNSGSMTAGVDGKTIEDIKSLKESAVISEVRKKLDDYKPQSVRRVFIPKSNGKQRPLGIPTIWDRLIQQCILQVLEPICEPKFHNHSYGFRPNRGSHHAISRCVSMINMYKHYYCVDIDIKGFFDNVNHGKLLKQLWTLGIRDKRLICIISKILKSEIKGEGIPTKGTPQGGIISPLLSLVVLNELDWWISNQWETYIPNGVRNGKNRGSKGWYQYAKNYTKMKDGYIIRYADDFKIMCRTYHEAQRYYHATVKFLSKRLKLDISPEKSKVVNMKRNSSQFLGFKIKVIPKGNTRYGYIAKTDMSLKSIKNAKKNLKDRIKKIQHNTTVDNICNYNSTILGIHNYYNIATNIYNNMSDISYSLLAPIRIRLKSISKTIPFSQTDKEFKSKTVGIRDDSSIVVIGEMPLLPIRGVHHRNPMNFSQNICNYTVEGRAKIHKENKYVTREERLIITANRNRNETIEFNDNCLSALSSQRGKCYILGEKVNPNEIICIRKKSKEFGGNDTYRNIALIHEKTIDLLKTTENDILIKLKSEFNLKGKQLKKINEIRIINGLMPISN